MRHSILDVRFEAKDFGFNDDQSPTGSFAGLASVYNVTDLHGDVVVPGAFTKTIQERGGRIKLLWQHDPNIPIGVGEISDSEAGLVLKGRLTLGTEKGREAYALLRDGVVDALSIGYDTVKQSKGEDGVRRISEIRLWEVSLVTFPANQLARIGAVKNAALERLKDDEAAEFAAVAENYVLDLKAGRVSTRTITVIRDAVNALLGALAPTEVEDPDKSGTPAAGAAETEVEPELLHSLGDLLTQAASLAAAK